MTHTLLCLVLLQAPTGPPAQPTDQPVTDVAPSTVTLKTAKTIYIAHNVHVYILAAMKKKGFYTLTLDPEVADLWMKGVVNVVKKDSSVAGTLGGIAEALAGDDADRVSMIASVSGWMLGLTPRVGSARTPRCRSSSWRRIGAAQSTR